MRTISINNIEFLENVSKEDVLKYFIKLESTKDIPYKELLLEMLTLSGNDLLYKVQEYVQTRCDTNPAFVWLGAYSNNRRDQEIRQWVYARISTKQIYSCGINDGINKLLEEKNVQGNIARLCHNNFNIGRIGATSLKMLDIKKENQIILGIVHPEPGKIGDIELIDGYHRLLVMINHGITNVKAYVGLKSHSFRVI